jgi:hypothetical protein
MWISNEMHTILIPIEKQDHTLKLHEMGNQIFKKLIDMKLRGHFWIKFC